MINVFPKTRVKVSTYYQPLFLIGTFHSYCISYHNYYKIHLCSVQLSLDLQLLYMILTQRGYCLGFHQIYTVFRVSLYNSIFVIYFS